MKKSKIICYVRKERKLCRSDRFTNPDSFWSGRQDSNLRPLLPKSSVLAKLNYFPINQGTYLLQNGIRTHIIFLEGKCHNQLDDSQWFAVRALVEQHTGFEPVHSACGGKYKI